MDLQKRSLRNINFIGLATLMLSLLLSSCATSTSPVPSNACPTTGTGTLELSISSPTGVTPNVLVKGATSQTLNASESLSLAAGKYQIHTQRVVGTADALVSDAFGELSPLQEVCVKASETTSVTLKYALHKASGHLWSTNTGGIVGLSRAQLASASSADASIKLSYPFKVFRGLTFDSMGHMFVAQFDNDAILMFNPSQMVSAEEPTPALRLTSSVIEGNTYGLAFDAEGNLWGTTWTTSIVFRYNASTLAELMLAGGEQTQGPDYQFALTAADHGRDLEFDAEGNLWVTAGFASESDKIFKFDSVSLTTASPSPSLTIEIAFPAGWFDFDAAGRLWFSQNGNLVRFSAAQLAGSGTQAIAFEDADLFIRSTNVFNGVLVDNSGDVWISDSLNGIRMHKATDTALGGIFNSSEDLNATQDLYMYP